MKTKSFKMVILVIFCLKIILQISFISIVQDPKPHPKKFDQWAKGGECPYKDCVCQQIHHFEIKKELWQPGKPTMTDYELLMAIAKEKKWKIG